MVTIKFIHIRADGTKDVIRIDGKIVEAKAKDDEEIAALLFSIEQEINIHSAIRAHIFYYPE